MCVRTQKFLAYASSAIFRTCYSRSIRTNFFYVRAAHDDRIMGVVIVGVFVYLFPIKNGLLVNL